MALPGRQTPVLPWQHAVQLGWMLAATLASSVFLAGIGPYARQVTLPCTSARCLAVQPTLAQHAATRIVLTDSPQLTAMLAFPAALCLLIAGACVWRRPQHRAARRGAWGLTALSTVEFARALAQSAPSLYLLVDLTQLAGALGLAHCLCRLRDDHAPARWVDRALGGLALLGVAIVLVGVPPTLQSAWAFALLGIVVVVLATQNRTTTSAPQHDQVTWALVALALLTGAQLIGRPLPLLPIKAGVPAALPPETFILMTVNGMVLMVGGLGCLAVALLRDELFDVELVLNRALVYTLLSIVVVAAYIVVVGYLSLLFQSSGNLWIALVATGVVAVAFQPLRERLQRLVNQLFYGQRDEPGAAVGALGRRLQQTLAPDAVLLAVVETVADTLRLPYVAISLRHGDGEVLAVAHGICPSATPLATFPLFSQGEEVGRLHVAPRPGEAVLAAADRRLLDELAHQAGPAVHAVQLTTALRRSREQLVLAREEERRRLRRDLHDGLGPTLASQALTIDTVGLLLERDPATAAHLLGEAKQQAQDAIGEIRRVVYELRPPALDDLGLVQALREQASRLGLSGVTIHVDVPEPLPPLPAAVEVAAYRIVSEALTNVTRHARAGRCTVTLTVDDGLVIVVADNGVGLVTPRSDGVGLRAMRERAEELGGSLEVRTVGVGGTTVRVRLPLEG
jgi:signal transduction histidine kinase